MIDLHCHILPAIDDGPAHLAESLEMARMAVADGVDTIVATPHVKELPYPAERIPGQVETFRQALQAAQIPLNILPGADVSALLEPTQLAPFTLNTTPYLLFEFPHSHVPQNAGQLVFNAIMAGLKPIITHPERNPSFMRQPQLLFDLVEAGALVQLTADSLTGGFGADARECALHILRRKQAHFLASDAHSSQRRRPGLSQAVAEAAQVIGKKAALKLVLDHPAAVLAGRELAD
ncbi:MAG: hypothetical protein P8X63_09480 [Desulfuromonadaceae bacterium]|jgi:protein-tyrosine phosphatase